MKVKKISTTFFYTGILGGAGAGIVIRLGNIDGGGAKSDAAEPSPETTLIKSPFVGAGPNIA